jgi:hypothetical protein
MFVRGTWVRLIGPGGELDSFFVRDVPGAEGFLGHINARLATKITRGEWELTAGDKIVLEEGESEV